LEKEGIETKLTRVLKNFRTKELSIDILNKEVEIVRQNLSNKKQ
jgi:hypothetical protein